MVQEGDFVRSGDELVMFEDISQSEVICNLTTTDLKWIRDNAPVNTERQENPERNEEFSVYQIPRTAVKVFEVSEPNIAWDGILERFDGIGRDESTRTIPCRITIKKPIFFDEETGTRRALVRGMYVKCKITVDVSADKSDRTLMYLPATALRSDKSVWVVRDCKLDNDDPKWNPDDPNNNIYDGIVPIRNLDVIQYTKDKAGNDIVVVATDEIKLGEPIVRTPIAQPTDNMEVDVDWDKKPIPVSENSDSD